MLSNCVLVDFVLVLYEYLLLPCPLDAGEALLKLWADG